MRQLICGLVSLGMVAGSVANVQAGEKADPQAIVAKAIAAMEGRDFVLPEDVQTVGPWAINHRMKFSASTAFARSEEFIKSVTVE